MEQKKIQEPVIINGGLSVDDRGVISFCNDFNFNGVKRFYIVENHSKGFIRAWHGHKNENKYVMVIKGEALIGVVNIDNKKLNKFILSEKQPKILFIPSGHANGFKTLTEGTKIIFFSTSTLEESLNDDIRYPYDKWGIWGEGYR